MTSVSFRTYGCSNNVAESEAMAGLLEKSGIVVKDSDAQVVVFNMCSVKGPSVKACIKEVKQTIEEFPNKKVIIAGCVPREIIAELKALGPQVSIVGTHHIDEIVNVVNSSEQLSFSKFDKKIKSNFPKKRSNPVVGIVPILSGCNDHCSYCSTVLIKGPTVSYPQEKILEEVSQAISEGCKEIWLTSQDNGAYLTDKEEVGLPSLIKNICSLEGDFYVRVGMANPTYLIECINELVDALKHPKVFKFLHIPLQAGSDEVLKGMKRRYSVEQFRGLIVRLKDEFPEMMIATDIITGFPGETDKQFEETLELVRELEFDIINISRFASRRGTAAAVMQEQVHGHDAKERSRKLTELFMSISKKKNEGYIGKELMVLVEDVGKNNSVIARAGNYKQVIIKENLPLGSLIKVKVINADTYHVVGERI